MPGLNLTSEQFRTAKQTIQSRYVKIELLNYNYQVVDSVEGKCTGGNFSIDANSDIRRTGSVALAVNDSTFEVEPGGSIWLDKYLRIHVGIYSLLNGEISWTNCGMFIIDAPSFHYDVASNTLNLSLLDLMAKMTGARNGYLKGSAVSFKAGQPIRDAIIAMLKLAGFTRYIVEEPPTPGLIPYDLEFDQGTTIYEVLKALADIYPSYEMFFDVNGTFIYQRKPTGKDDPVMVDDSLWETVVINDDINIDFQNVKNSIEVYGRTHEPSVFSTETTVVGNEIHLTIPSVAEYSENLIYGFTLTDNPGYNNMMLKVNELAAYPVVLDNNAPAEIKPEEGEVYYCVQFKGDHWNWLGHLQSYGFAEDTNPDSPFYVEGTVGRIRLPLFGDIYENIFTDDLAEQRAKYELYLHSQLNDSISLTCVPVYWLDVNIKVEYTTRRNNRKEQYIITSVNMGLLSTDTMTVQMMRFYPNV